MLSAVMTSPGRIEFRQTAIPDIRENEVLIKIRRIGVCGSDIHVYHGRHPYTSYPVVQGHEVSGEISEVGAKVKALKAGDRVTVQPQAVCGSCYSCTHGSYNICDSLKVMGFQTTGMASEYFTANSEKVLKLPDDMSFDEGALVEPLAVACHAIGRSGMNLKEKKVLVLGAGPIGNLVAQTAKARGADKVMITDISRFRLDAARNCGADAAVNVIQDDLGKAIEDEFGPDKADVIFECAGVQSTAESAVINARKGTDIIIVAVYPGDIKINMGLVQDRELRLIGTLMYKKEDYLDAIELLSSGKIHSDKIITDHFAFKDYLKAYKYIDERKDKILKVMIDVAD